MYCSSLLQSFEELGPYMLSLQRLHSLAPSVLYPGHGPTIVDGSQKIKQYLEHREGREKQVRDREGREKQVRVAICEGSLRVLEVGNHSKD